MNAKKTIQIKSPQEMSILLVEDLLDDNSEIKKTLIALGYKISEQISSECKLSEKCARYDADILIIRSQSLTPKMLKELTFIDQLSPLPVLIFTTHEAQSHIHTSIKAGVSAYIIDEIPTHRLTSLITVACERFNERQSLRNELEETKTQLANRKTVERAKGFIMQQKKISEQEAFTMLRKMAMNNGHSLATVAKNVIEVSELLTENHH